MPNKLMLAISLIVFTQIGFAETCPSVNDIKSQALTGWKIFDSDDGAPLSSQRAIQFKKTIEQFVLAEWTNQNNKTHAIHCYYRDHSGSNLEAYLAKDNFVPNNNNKYWYQVSGFMHCAAGKEKCEFKKIILAKK